jgi:signal transduction histidine kinase
MLFVVILVRVHAQESKNALLSKLGESKGEERIEILHKLVLELWLSNPASALDYAEEALTLSLDLGNQMMISKSYRRLSGVYYYLGDYENSLQYNLLALKIALETNDSAAIHSGYNNNGLQYYILGNYQTAMEYLLRSKQIKERIGEKFSMPYTLNNIGLVYWRVGQYDQAKEYFNEALALSTKMDFKDQRIESLNNLGVIYVNQGELDTAKSYFSIALQISKAFGNTNFGAVARRGLGEVWMYKGNYDSAEAHLSVSLNQSLEIFDKKGMSETYYLLSKLALIKGEFKKSLQLLDKSHEVALQLKLRQQLLENLKLYIIIYQHFEDDKNVILFQSKYSNLRDSLFQDVVVRNLALIPLKIKEEEDRERLLSQESEIELKNAQNRLFILIIFISIPFSVFLILLLIKNKRSKNKLSEKNDRLLEAQSHIITSEKMASLGSLAAGIGHEINNPLNFIKNGSLIIKMKVAENSEELSKELIPFFGAIEEGVSRAAGIVKSLSHFSKVGLDMNEICNINDVINNCLLVIKNKLREKAEVNLDLTSDPAFVLGNEGKLHQAFLNILTNAEQAIQEKGKIEVVTRLVNQQIVVTIRDNGSGIPEEHLKKISNPFFTTKETGIGTGLGLFITYSIIDEHDGSIKVSSKLNEHTEFVVSLPSVDQL